VSVSDSAHHSSSVSGAYAQSQSLTTPCICTAGLSCICTTVYRVHMHDGASSTNFINKPEEA
jgi:hypothetical protein